MRTTIAIEFIVIRAEVHSFIFGFVVGENSHSTGMRKEGRGQKCHTTYDETSGNTSNERNRRSGFTLYRLQLPQLRNRPRLRLFRCAVPLFCRRVEQLRKVGRILDGWHFEDLRRSRSFRLWSHNSPAIISPFHHFDDFAGFDFVVCCDRRTCIRVHVIPIAMDDCFFFFPMWAN